MKIAVVADSNSGITQEEGKRLGIYVLPMPFIIDGETYEEDVTLTQEQFYEKQASGADISTSQPSPESVMDLWDRLLEQEGYEQIVHIPMSSGLSGSCQTARMLAEDYDGRVQVVDNQRISVTQRQSAIDARDLAAAGFDAAQIRETLERMARESSIYVMVDTLKYLKKGGRITPAAAALGTLLKIKPVLQIQGEKLDTFSKARTVKQAKNIMLAAAVHDLEERYHDPEAEHTWLAVVQACNPEAAGEFAAEIRERFPKTDEIYMDSLSLSISTHTGPNILAVACTKKLDIEAEKERYGI